MSNPRLPAHKCMSGETKYRKQIFVISYMHGYSYNIFAKRYIRPKILEQQIHPDQDKTTQCWQWQSLEPV